MRKKKSCVSIIILILFISSLTVFATQNYKEIKVLYKDINLYINNKELELNDKPFIYNNKIYAPIRSISQALNAKIQWNNNNNNISISSFNDFDEANPLAGERFVYGEILSINKEKMTLHIYQHIDDNTIYENTDLKISKDVIVVLQRNDKKINLDFEDLKIGDIAGMVVNNENEVRGMIIDK